jgi:hypothetical protein
MARAEMMLAAHVQPGQYQFCTTQTLLLSADLNFTGRRRAGRGGSESCLGTNSSVI